MLSPSIRPSRKGVTFANGTTKERPDGGTPTQSPPLVPSKGAPHDHHVIPEGSSLVLRRQIGKGREVPLVGHSHRRPSLAAQAERMRIEEAVFDERREDRVHVAGRFGVAMGLEEASIASGFMRGRVG